MKNDKPILEVKNISKNFSGIYALSQVNIRLFPGKVCGLIGENGAGKSTLMKIISGVYRGYEGNIIYEGETIQFSGPKEASEKGIRIIHQELNLIPNLSIAENIFLGQEIKNRFGFLDYTAMHKKTNELMSLLHLNVAPSTQVSSLKVGQQQIVEIAKALLFESKVLIMDEPTSAISDNEVELLFKIISNLKEKGVAVVYISHRLNELFQIADTYSVLRDGQSVGSGNMEDITHEQLIQKMVGRKLEHHENKKDFSENDEVLRVEGLKFINPSNKNEYLVDDINFKLRKGEVLGICGLMGAGRTELLEAIFGVHPKYVSCKIFIEGKRIKINSIGDAINNGIALVPEDRKTQGLILNMNIAKNTSLACLDSVCKYTFIMHKKERELSTNYINKLNTKAGSENIEVEKLSGGNQQKVVIAKWLATKPLILLLDEPTRGIDIGAKAEIYKLIDELASQGMGIIVVSSELPEILALADNILVLSESKQTAYLKRNEATEEIIMKAAISEIE